MSDCEIIDIRTRRPAPRGPSKASAASKPADDGVNDDPRYWHINRLPFVKCKLTSWGRRPDHYWTVTTSGDRHGPNTNRNKAREYARLLVEAMRYRDDVGSPYLLRLVVHDMVTAERRVRDKKERLRRATMRDEFFWEIGRIIARNHD